VKKQPTGNYLMNIKGVGKLGKVADTSGSMCRMNGKK